MSLRYLSVCSGIEAASVAWQPLGWQPVAFSEIEPAPCRLLAHHYPDVPNLGDMTKFQEWPSRDELAIDLLCGGTPCQSFSVAGLRKGLDDPRGNLMLTFGAIAAKYRPKWLVWENVPGVLSSNGGRDFAAFLGLLTGQQIAAPVGGWKNAGIIPGYQNAYGVAYRILDAQYFGVAQRRRRVFVVGHLGDWRRAAAVLFERHSLQGHPAPQRKAGQGFAVDAVPSLTASGRGTSRTGESRGNDPVIAVAIRGRDDGATAELGDNVANALRASQGGGDKPYALVPDIAMCLNAGGMGQQDAESETLIAVPEVTHSLRGEGFDASEDGTGRGTPLVPVAYRTAGDGNVYEEGSATAPLTTGTDQSASIIAFSSKDYGNDAQVDLSPTLRSMAHDKSHMNGGGQIAIAFDSRMRGPEPAVGRAERPPQTMIERTGALDSTKPWNVATNLRVRRLTPLECERLQGFPDGYTNVAKLSDSARYKALGNSWAVPCARWIGERINLVNQIPTEHSEAA